MSTELATTGGQAVALRYELEVEDLIAQVVKIQTLMAKVMKKDEHYGVIPGTGTKPTLLKPGAEKLCLLFRLAPDYHSAETYDGKHLTVKTTCALWHIPTAQKWGSGEGSCSTKESKYAYRQAKRVCPKCGSDAILRSKYPPKGRPNAPLGWYCFAKRGGCGQEFDAADPAIMDQAVGRVPNEDVADQYNTILKMSNKRALVAAVLNVTAASDIFTQDIEDLAQHAPSAPPAGEIIDAEPVTAAPVDLDRQDKAALLAAYHETTAALGLTATAKARLWRDKIGPGVTEDAADIDKLVALAAELAERRSAAMSGDPAPGHATAETIGDKEIPF